MRDPNNNRGLISPDQLEDVRYRAGVSDHAVVRWLERVEGYPVEQLKRDMLSPLVLGAMAMGASRVLMPQRGVALVLGGCNVITTVPLRRERR